ncbi:homoserine O-succinyltransferase [Pseudosulfitobacter sp. DSM 107133]|uniref:homoserine O-acetyltransferase MetA n=1 Tax=Pseudosulfitobacter sp. DSM 107133 TaxID=2883100 RepID=UPI000DF1EB7D|nr:homoserine O-succinyltransferase [Pseudosulfitobacter sp. DSM 107133]UOA27442.1 Homoserine O-acetyltransferase [Pseudosulfitobacter sp. DSM 107133]
MPIKIPSTLPAYDVLTREGVMVLDEELAASQDIRPLRIALLNLMPKKIQTENQFARLIGATPLQIEFSLLRMTDHNTRNTAAEHMEAFYRPVSEVVDEKFDGLIITGAPIEHLDFDAVGYWDELQRVMDWTQTNVHSTFGVCWGGMAMINHFHGVQKHMLDKKAFGCFRHQNLAPASPYLRGFSDDCVIPVSRWTEMRQAEVDNVGALRTLLGSDEVGPCLVEDVDHRALYIFNHFEYDSDTLKQEYDRDVASGTEINVPINYYPNNDPSQPPQNRWRSHAHLLYGNWINEIYQSTPFDLAKIGT